MPAVFDNCYFGKSGRNAITMNGGELIGRNNTFENAERAGVSLSGESYAHLSNTKASKNGAAMRVENSGFRLDHPMFTDNDIGVDLLPGSSGDIFRGYIKDNKEADIRYYDYVLVGLFDSAAQSVQNLSEFGEDIMWVDQQWAASRVIDTTEILLKARNVLNMAKKTSKWSSRLRLAVKLAKLVLTG